MITPKTQADLVGHGAVEEELLAAWMQNSLHHSMIFVGPKGVGKATVAFRLARFLFTKIDPSEEPKSLYISPEAPVFRRVVSGGHGDLLAVEASKGELAVDDIRAVTQFFSRTPMEGGWRIAIIDGPMNRNAANALLKTLEEPPKQSMLILVTESIGQLPATIISRCRQVKFSNLSKAQAAIILRQVVPDMEEHEIGTLSDLANGSPGRAIAIYDLGGIEVYQDLVALLTSFSYSKAVEFCRKYANQETLALVGEFLIQIIYKFVTPGDSEENPLLNNLRAVRPLEQWALVWEKINSDFKQAQQFHLEATQVMLGAIAEMVEVKK